MDCAFRDWPLHVLHAAQGPVGLFITDEILATWRLHAGGRWTATDFAQKLAGLWQCISETLEAIRRSRRSDNASSNSEWARYLGGMCKQ